MGASGGDKARKGRGLAAAVVLAVVGGVVAFSASSVARCFAPEAAPAVSSESASFSSLPPQSLPTLAFLASRGGASVSLGFAMPVSHSEARVSGLFGWRENPFTGLGREFHEGLDIAAPKGAAVSAWREGRVSASYDDAGTGKTVEIVHADGSVSVYAHLSERLCAAGEIVARGETVGRVGYSGRSTGPHLHFAVKVEGNFVDPLPLLADGGMLYASLKR